VVTPGDVTTGLGDTVANSWAIYEGIGPAAKVVAHAQGLHMRVGSWFNSFAILFETGRFKGSTLQVMGSTVDDAGEWAIVGGTGAFAIACGTINRKVHAKIPNGEIQELTISGYCKMQLPVPVKFGPWGGSAGPDLPYEPRMIESITIASGDVIDSFSFTYIDRAGQRRTGGRWGNGPGTVNPTIQLGPSELVIQMSGTIAIWKGERTIASLTFITTNKTYGPFGSAIGTPFSVSVPQDQSIVGFFGKSGKYYLESLGVYHV